MKTLRGGEAKHNGWDRLTVGKAVLIVQPNCGGCGGRFVGMRFATRCN